MKRETTIEPGVCLVVDMSAGEWEAELEWQANRRLRVAEVVSERALDTRDIQLAEDRLLCRAIQDAIRHIDNGEVAAGYQCMLAGLEPIRFK